MGKRDLIILFGAVVASVILVVSQFFGSSIATGAWGLSFPREGASPKGPVDSQTLQKYDAAFMGDTAKPVVYLTFDAGYENGCTEQILDVLKAHRVPAAFFLVGSYIEKNPDLVRRMVEEGHIVGNHTMHHPEMDAITDPDAFARELQQVEELFLAVTGKELPKFYRPPQGIYSQDNLKMAQDLGYRTVFWSLAYADWNNNAQPSREQAFSKLLPRVHNGAVVLLHSTSATNAAILDELLTKWEAMGYGFASIDTLFCGT